MEEIKNGILEVENIIRYLTRPKVNFNIFGKIFFLLLNSLKWFFIKVWPLFFGIFIILIVIFINYLSNFFVFDKNFYIFIAVLFLFLSFPFLKNFLGKKIYDIEKKSKNDFKKIFNGIPSYSGKDVLQKMILFPRIISEYNFKILEIYEKNNGISEILEISEKVLETLNFIKSKKIFLKIFFDKDYNDRIGIILKKEVIILQKILNNNLEKNFDILEKSVIEIEKNQEKNDFSALELQKNRIKVLQNSIKKL